MARLNILRKDEEAEDDLPELATILRTGAEKKPQQASESSNVTATKQIEHSSNCTEFDISTSEIIPKNEPNIDKKERFESARHRGANSLLPSHSKGQMLQDEERQLPTRIRSTPKRVVAKSVNYRIFPKKKEDRRISISEDDDSFTDLSGFIVPDSESDSEERERKEKQKKFHRPSARSSDINQGLDDIQASDTLSESSEGTNIRLSKAERVDSLNLRSAILDTPCKNFRQSSVKPSHIGDDFSRLKVSPSRSRRVVRLGGLDGHITPPSSPHKATLPSPSKKHRIQPSPHRPSVDAFWSQDLINDWNDQYSPRKPPQTPNKHRHLPLDEEDEDSSNPFISPSKNATKSPSKKDKEAVRAFNKVRHDLATSFLNELDEKITSRQISTLTTSTGGIHIEWSKRLASTAGRANWRREAVRHKNPDGTFSSPTYRHHASIELAEKVIDTEARLINVLAHEFCHLANFMISGVKDQPHGKAFKGWASKVTREFRDRGVEVTTKHGYDINYKYVWMCGECGVEYKRHSKSIDPAKHSCGACKGKLVQVLPAPRKESEYQRFVKANWDRVKGVAGEGAGMGDINGLLAKEWEAKKTRVEKSKRVVVTVAEVADDAGDESGKREDDSQLGDLTKNLDLLTLKV